MWLSAHYVTGRSDRRNNAAPRRASADQWVEDLCATSIRNAVSNYGTMFCGASNLASTTIGMSVAEGCCMKRKTTVTTSVTRSA